MVALQGLHEGEPTTSASVDTTQAFEPCETSASSTHDAIPRAFLEGLPSELKQKIFEYFITTTSSSIKILDGQPEWTNATYLDTLGYSRALRPDLLHVLGGKTTLECTLTAKHAESVQRRFPRLWVQTVTTLRPYFQDPLQHVRAKKHIKATIRILRCLPHVHTVYFHVRGDSGSDCFDERTPAKELVRNLMKVLLKGHGFSKILYAADRPLQTMILFEGQTPMTWRAQAPHYRAVRTSRKIVSSYPFAVVTKTDLSQTITIDVFRKRLIARTISD